MIFTKKTIIALLLISGMAVQAVPRGQKVRRIAAQALVRKAAPRNQRRVVQPAKARAALRAVNARGNRGARNAVIGAARLRTNRNAPAPRARGNRAAAPRRRGGQNAAPVRVAGGGQPAPAPVAPRAAVPQNRGPQNPAPANFRPPHRAPAERQAPAPIAPRAPVAQNRRPQNPAPVNFRPVRNAPVVPPAQAPIVNIPAPEREVIIPLEVEDALNRARQALRGNRHVRFDLGDNRDQQGGGEDAALEEAIRQSILDAAPKVPAAMPVVDAAANPVQEANNLVQDDAPGIRGRERLVINGREIYDLPIRNQQDIDDANAVVHDALRGIIPVQMPVREELNENADDDAADQEAELREAIRQSIQEANAPRGNEPAPALEDPRPVAAPVRPELNRFKMRTRMLTSLKLSDKVH